MDKKSIVFFLIFSVFILLAIFFFYKKSYNAEKRMEVNFIVERVEITLAYRARLYDKNNNKLRLQCFVFYDFHKIQPGDYILKEKGEKYLIVYRNDSIGNKRVYLKMYIN